MRATCAMPFSTGRNEACSRMQKQLRSMLVCTLAYKRIPYPTILVVVPYILMRTGVLACRGLHDEHCHMLYGYTRLIV